MKKFNLFNYAKEGPGVSKTSVMEKKTIIQFFELYFQSFRKLVTAGLLYLLFWVPLVTNGLGAAGLTNITRNIYCGRHSFGASDFFETIKKNWKQSLGLGILKLLAILLIAFATYYYGSAEGTLADVGLGVCIFLIFAVYTMMNYIPLMTVSFSLKTGKIISNSFKFVFLNLWRNLLIVLLDVVVAAIAVFIIMYGDSHAVAITIYGLVVAIIYPSFRALAVQFCIFPSVRKYMIDPYYEQHPDADIELRRSLGLLKEEDNPEDRVFEDTI